jgi:ribose 5-phosphate isomerase B
MKIGLAADHGGFQMKQVLAARLRVLNHDVIDFGAVSRDPDDDDPDSIMGSQPHLCGILR